VPVGKTRSEPRAELTEQKLIRGWTTGVPRVKVRLATPTDLPAIADLVTAADVDLGAPMTAAMREGTMGQAHRTALANRRPEHGCPAFTRAMAEAFGTHGADHAYLAAALVLVAEHRDHGVIGTVVVYPPPNVADQYVAHAERGTTAGNSTDDIRKLISAGAIGLAKVSALAVTESARRTGIGGALLARVKKIYFHHGYFYVYGQMPDRPGLPEFYRHQGFEVKEPGADLDLWVVFGIPGGIYPGPGERIFVRGRPHDGPDRE
jgi:GNAT superfamily N-acetyltransferase